MLPTNLFGQQPGYDDRRRSILQQLRNLHTGGLSRVAWRTLPSKGREGKGQYLLHSSGAPCHRGHFLYKRVSQESTLELTMFCHSRFFRPTPALCTSTKFCHF